MALFENFPYTNLHELNLDWLIQEMKDLEEKVQDGPVISVNGQTGIVTLYQEAQVQLPDITDSQQTFWNIFRYLNGHIYGIRFDSNGNVYAIRDGVRTKLLTWTDIPPDAGVISVNGLYGVVHISGTDIPWMGGETDTVFDKLSANEDAIDELTITLGTLSNAIKAGIAYLEPNVDDTAIHNIPAGKYVFWKNYPYKSTQAISIGDTLSSTNLQAVGAGGFINALQAELQTQISTVNNRLNTIKVMDFLGTFTTVSQLTGFLDTLVNSMNNGDIYSFVVTCGATIDVFINTLSYAGIVYRPGTANYVHVMLYSNSNTDVISGTKVANEGWTFKKLTTDDIKIRSAWGDSISSENDLSFVLDTQLNNMSIWEIRNGEFYFSGTPTTNFYTARYLIELSKGAGIASCSAIITMCGGVGMILAGRNSTGWTYTKVI